MTDKLNVAIVGATGVVGETFLKILEQREFPIGELHLLASERSVGKRLAFNNKSYVVADANTFDFSQTDLVLMSAGSAVSKQIAPKAVKQGATVIDNSSAFRYDDDIPLVVPEVNFAAIQPEHKLIANPNCSTIQMVVALKPIYDHFGIEMIHVSTYQAVSGAGKGAIDELAGQTASLLNAQPAESNTFKKQIAFNVLPDIDELQENGFTREEMKLCWETQKIFDDASVQVNATAVRVPVFYGHSEAVHIKTKKAVDMQQVLELLQVAEGVELVESGDYPTAFTHANDQDPVFVGRVRQDFNHDYGLNLWVVADNLRKCAALNAIQIAERLFL